MRKAITPPFPAIGTSRASWSGQGKPATKPQRQAIACVARSAGISVKSIDRTAQACRDKCAARLRQYQDWMLRKFLKKYPWKSGEQIARMINAHTADLSAERLAKILDPVVGKRAGKAPRTGARAIE